MRHTSAAVTSLVAFGIVIVLGGSEGPVAAQAGAEQNWLRVDTVQVKPEMWTEYRTIERDEVIPALRKAGVPSRSAWRTAEFGSTYELVFARPIADFAEYDLGDSFNRGLAPREAERLRERIRRCLLGRESAAIMQRADLSVGETGRPFAVVTTLLVAPGRSADYEAFLRDTLPDLRKAGIVFGVYQRVYGHEAAWLLVQNLDSLKDLGQPGGLFRAYGTEGAEGQIARLSGIVTSVARKVLRYDPELSFSLQTGGPAQ